MAGATLDLGERLRVIFVLAAQFLDSGCSGSLQTVDSVKAKRRAIDAVDTDWLVTTRSGASKWRFPPQVDQNYGPT